VSSICCTSTLSPLSSTSKPSTLNPQPKALVCNPPSYLPRGCVRGVCMRTRVRVYGVCVLARFSSLSLTHAGM
jgi:hypothetical protein